MVREVHSTAALERRRDRRGTPLRQPNWRPTRYRRRTWHSSGDGVTLFHHEGFLFRAVPRRGAPRGRAGSLGDRSLSPGASISPGRPVRASPRLNGGRAWGGPHANRCRKARCCRRTSRPVMPRVSTRLLEAIEAGVQAYRTTRTGGLRGDCHHGNILWTGRGAHSRGS